MSGANHDSPLDPALLRASGALLAAHLAVGAAIERGAVSGSEHDATTLDLLVRLALADDGRMRAVDLCDQLKLSASHVSRMLDRAEGAGLVRREPDPADRRAKVVALTAAGQEAVDRFAPRLHDVLHRTVHAALSARETEVLVELLERIEAAADEV